MTLSLPLIPEVKARTAAELELHFAKNKPFIVRGLSDDWPLVQAGKVSGKAARDYLLSKAQDRPFTVSLGPRDSDGRLFYREDMSMNTRTGKTQLSEVFRKIDEVEADENLPIIYMSAVDIKNFFTGLHEDNHLSLGERTPRESIWIGTKSRIAAHNDFPDNLAFVAAGRRRFTLFPPEQFTNLYIGPLDNTPAGRAISMVDFSNPDFEKFPKFKDALKAGIEAELAPGDAIHIPSNWWHHVEGMEPFNVLVNYWWRETPQYLGNPQYALNHAMLAVRDLPHEEKAYWRKAFDYYVFENSDAVTDHIPDAGKGVLGPMTASTAGKIRSFLIKMLSHE